MDVIEIGPSRFTTKSTEILGDRGLMPQASGLITLLWSKGMVWNISSAMA
jgi:hypothetical protein